MEFYKEIMLDFIYNIKSNQELSDVTTERIKSDLGAFTLGMIEAIKTFSIWNNGKQYIGSPEKEAGIVAKEIQDAYNLIKLEL